MTDLHEAFETILTPPKIWDKYMALEYRQGVPPETYRQLKAAFFSGMFVTLTEIYKIDNEKNEKTALKYSKDLFGSIRKQDGLAVHLFKDWFRFSYPEDTPEPQKQHLLKTFLQGMSEAMVSFFLLTGPNSEDDDIGAKRLKDFGDAITAEMQRIVDADTEIHNRSTMI